MGFAAASVGRFVGGFLGWLLRIFGMLGCGRFDFVSIFSVIVLFMFVAESSLPWLRAAVLLMCLTEY